MKPFFTIFLLFAGFSISAQKALTFKEILKTAKEIVITDNLFINYFSLEKESLDSITGNKFFQLISQNENPSFQKTKYFISGKITKFKDFNILLLCSEQMIANRGLWDPESGVVYDGKDLNLFFILLDKENNYKTNFLVAMNFEKNDYVKTITGKISSCIYNDLKIIQHSEIESGKKKFDFSMEYHINDFGVFVAYPNYTKN